ncbi:MAG TPA: Tex family protein [Candidatus Thiothrix moscowensis]|uniref:Tex family protein n=1 Tax=unclassified Thiothrix TaxID=2636184 RepID=UPI0025CF6965|nr:MULTISPECIES: Tex family protein [unclassified Thiothrix]HRJ52446.1 Tex family protein [Candidatus Thiothrix moscowensis]HRJ93368.1 Tex family protein [Candidatus Thiothrix moscowensis]
MQSILSRIATELAVRETQVVAAVELLDEGSTVPFIARYRKEKTGGLDDTQLRYLETRLGSLRELEKRRETVLNSIREQGKLTAELEQQVLQASTRTELEDIYLPYKPKRRTKAMIAREAGIQPLAEALLANPGLDPESEAVKYLNSSMEFADTKAVLDGARQILMEDFAENAELSGQLREYLWEQGSFEASVISGKEQEGQKFSDYFAYAEAIGKIPSHRALALFRGRNEGILDLKLDVPVAESSSHPCEVRIAAAFNIRDQGRAADRWLLDTVRWAWKVKLHSRLSVDLNLRLREQAEAEAIRVFAANLKDLLLAAPAGSRATLGLDPGLRTGVKVAVVDATGKLLDTATIYPHVPKKQWDQSLAVLAELCAKHDVELVSIGNGTASRETDQLAADLIKRHPELKLSKIVVSEAGASVYSASELAAKEFPLLDVSLRGAVSIARRLQDPLAELVKIEPKSIGVGQYQHDVNQPELARSLDAVVEDCVNAVGVDVNIASAALLARVAGLNQGIAENIVAFRNDNGAFRNRNQLKKVSRLGAKTFEQAAGFLRIRDGEHPLDASAVHPETYTLVEQIAAVNRKPLAEMVGNGEFVRQLKPTDYVTEQFGLPTIRDILAELEKPGRDPRPEFVTAIFREGVNELADLQPGMILEGVVTNVANFGAFVDIGVHQDGLVHISQLTSKFIKDPREVVRTGDVVKVRVEEVDVQRKRISLTMRLDNPAEQKASPKPVARERDERKQAGHAGQQQAGRVQGNKKPAREVAAAANSAMGDALAAAFARSRK